MRVQSFIAVACAAAGLVLAVPQESRAQSWGLRDVWTQRDRPGDWRCDAYWDANRTDCGAAWRDQRHRSTLGRYREGHARYDWRRHGGRAHPSGEAWYGAYGRPDVIHSSGGGYAHGRDPRRIDWCRARYRSYDPASGYYRAYSGRLIYCG